MSSRAVIRTLRFCSRSAENLTHALKLLGLDFEKREKSVSVEGRTIVIGEGCLYMQLYSDDIAGISLFSKINARLSRVEQICREEELSRLERERERALEEEERHRVRRIQAEKDRLEYEREKLALEERSFVEAKKQAIIKRAREMGYSVEEREENGAVKLKLIKRIY